MCAIHWRCSSSKVGMQIRLMFVKKSLFQCFGAGEPPAVIHAVSTSGQGDTLKAVNEGGLAEFVCESDGEPLPEFTWQLSDGGSLPSDARVTNSGGRSVLQVLNQ